MAKPISQVYKDRVLVSRGRWKSSVAAFTCKKYSARPFPDQPSRIGKMASLAFHRSGHRQHRARNRALEKLRLQKIFDGMGEFRIACDLDPLHRAEHAGGQQGKSGVGRSDIAQ